MEQRHLCYKLSSSRIVPNTVYHFEALDACPRRQTFRDGFLYWSGGDRGKYL